MSTEPVDTAALRAKIEAGAFTIGGLDVLGEENARLNAEVDRLTATLDRVRALHVRMTDPAGGDKFCRECTDFWPCPTIRALDGPA